MISDTYFYGNEELALAFIHQHYLAFFPKLLSNSRFNRRRRALGACIEGMRRALSPALIDPDDALRLTDRAPIPVAPISEATPAKPCREQNIAASW